MSAAPFVHEALFYRGLNDYLARTIAFITDGLARDEPVLVATPPDNLKLIQETLGPARNRVWMEDMCQVGRNPGRILPAVLLAFARAHPGRRIRVIEEPVWPGRSALEYPACVQYEALLNAVFAGQPASLLCPYHAADLAPRVLADAERTHPLIITGDSRRPSPRFADPFATARSFNVPLSLPPANAVTVPVAAAELGDLRRIVIAQACAAGVAPARASETATAVNELASNTVTHAAGPGVLAIWPEDGRLVCQLTDCGYIADPLAGRIPPPPEAINGRGLVIVNQLCDLVLIHTEPGRTTIRIHVDAN